MMLKMLKTQLLFVLLFLLLFFFTAAFQILNLTEGMSFPYLFFQVVLGMFGSISISNFMFGESPQQAVGAILFIVYVITVPILTINFLIALMTQSFDNLGHKKESVFFRNQATISLDAYQIYRNLRCIIPYFPKLQEVEQITISYQREHHHTHHSNLLYNNQESSPKQNRIIEDLVEEIQDLRREVKNSNLRNFKKYSDKTDMVSSKNNSDFYLSSYG
eukprot:TRINITY_DN48981_c0_g1_i1.p2 TRINITY_DN48981_c0_g1~~TRINITY_DN48981_c0_g1_i1.p2  ORF type:complete len:218 (-),score=34.64 TRINITY_DN48981_c0_g1_i1:584-1237(-)